MIKHKLSQFRRQVMDGYKIRPGGNEWQVTLWCGHTGIANGSYGKRPKTSACFKCYSEAKDKAANHEPH